MTILDSDRQFLANVKDFGARGDGVTDDTAAIQKAVDEVYGKGGGVVFFPSGTYLVTSVNIRENITYQGDKATLTRPAMQGKWLRTFTTQNRKYSGANDSKPLIIKNLTFDGNSQNQGPYQNFELEQAHLIFLTGSADQPGRLRAVVEDCHFQNGVADGVSGYINVDLKVYNCTAENVFRGGVVLTGGHSLLYVKNLVTGGKIDATGITVEVDGVGYGGSLEAHVVLEDITCLDGEFDIELPRETNSSLKATRIKSLAPPYGKMSFYFYGGGTGTAEFNDCEIFSNGGKHQIHSPGNVTFNRCSFVAADSSGNASEIFAFPVILWNNRWSSFKNETVTLNDCIFAADSSVNRSSKRTGIVYSATDHEDNNLLIIKGGVFAETLDRAITSQYGGGKMILSGVNFKVDTSAGSYPIYLSGHDGDNSWNWDVTIDNCRFNTTSYIYIYGYDSSSYPCKNNFLRQGNIIITSASNNIGTFNGITNNNFIGLGSNPVMRVIEGKGEPGNAPGFRSADGKFFDLYKDMTDPANPVYYKIINMQPYTWTKYTP